MRIDKTPLNEETKAKIVQMLNTAEDKTQAITDGDQRDPGRSDRPGRP